MPIPSVKTPPPPPRRVPPAAAPTQEVSVGTYVTAHLELKLNGVAVTSQQLIQTKDAVNDIKMALATADDTIHRITSNPALLGSAPGDSTKGGVDIQSLQFAAATREKLNAQEQKQAAHYASLREMDSVGQEVRKASRDASLLRYREEAECQLASSAFPGARFPTAHGGAASGAAGAASARPMAAEEHQALLNPFTTVRRQSKSGALTTSGVFTNTNNNSTSVSSSGTAPHRPSPSSSFGGSGGGGATAPPETHMHAPSGAPPVYSAVNGPYSGGLGSSAPPAANAGVYHPPPSASPQLARPYGAAPSMQGGYSAPSAYPPTVTPATMPGAYIGQGGTGYYGASPYPPQGQPRPVYGQYSQQPPTAVPHGMINRPTYTAL